jgi:hypothetical protein
MGFLLSVIALVFVFLLHQRVDRLERKIADLRQPAPGPVPSRATVGGASSSSLLPPTPLGNAASSGSPSWQNLAAARPASATSLSRPDEFDLGEWLSKDWPVKLGALLLLLGFGWLVSYAFLNNWIGPVGRISLGIVSGLAILLVGEWRIRSFSHQGSVFLALGSTVVLLTVFAARTAYGFFTPLSAILFMTLVVVFVAVSSVLHRNRTLAFLSLISGALVPILAASGNPNFAGLFSYLFLLSAGILWIVHLTGWRGLSLAAWACVALYSLPFIVGISYVRPMEKPAAVLFAFLFAFLFYGVNLSSLVRSRRAEAADLVVTALSGILFLSWIHVLIDPEWRSLVLVLVTLVASLGAFVVFRATDVLAPVLVYSGKALVFLAVAMAYELSGSALAIAYTLEAGLAAAGACLFLRSRHARAGFAWVMAVPVILSFGSVAKYAMARRVFTEDFFALLVLMAVFVVLSLLYGRREAEEASESPLFRSGDVPASTVLVAAAWFYALLLVWQTLHAAIREDDVATGLSLFVYTVLGLFFHIQGKLADRADWKTLGGVLLGLVAARLLLVEVWDMGVGGRIVVFLLIGALFMSTAFFGNKKIRNDERAV